ncbi:hypothetical protein CPB83DRAFT_892131 [Crepidotus variabilis]|uniref:Uncharacterized protein n=1 Tax=Crepidotus variabilis TaxID=179855 RepID=A0A9P6ELL6_9AGAR|nr:hypothetical protein CPB83DRAFT_892131 [Crepidotus variabilis]
MMDVLNTAANVIAYYIPPYVYSYLSSPIVKPNQEIESEVSPQEIDNSTPINDSENHSELEPPPPPQEEAAKPETTSNADNKKFYPAIPSDDVKISSQLEERDTTDRAIEVSVSQPASPENPTVNQETPQPTLMEELPSSSESQNSQRKAEHIRDIKQAHQVTSLDPTADIQKLKIKNADVSLINPFPSANPSLFTANDSSPQSTLTHAWPERFTKLTDPAEMKSSQAMSYEDVDREAISPGSEKQPPPSDSRDAKPKSQSLNMEEDACWKKIIKFEESPRLALKLDPDSQDLTHRSPLSPVDLNDYVKVPPPQEPKVEVVNRSGKRKRLSQLLRPKQLTPGDKVAISDDYDSPGGLTLFDALNNSTGDRYGKTAFQHLGDAMTLSGMKDIAKAARSVYEIVTTMRDSKRNEAIQPVVLAVAELCVALHLSFRETTDQENWREKTQLIISEFFLRIDSLKKICFVRSHSKFPPILGSYKWEKKTDIADLMLKSEIEDLRMRSENILEELRRLDQSKELPDDETPDDEILDRFAITFPGRTKTYSQYISDAMASDNTDIQMLAKSVMKIFGCSMRALKNKESTKKLAMTATTLCIMLFFSLESTPKDKQHIWSETMGGLVTAFNSHLKEIERMFRDFETTHPAWLAITLKKVRTAVKINKHQSEVKDRHEQFDKKTLELETKIKLLQTNMQAQEMTINK